MRVVAITASGQVIGPFPNSRLAEGFMWSLNQEGFTIVPITSIGDVVGMLQEIRQELDSESNEAER